ncbi:murein biosynthesis integral membrane protein MurJ [Candidatus Uhrbacteria bacterium]|nr:murein biosynthesis integral membrane protein MurJ [Candidatus Uhrbacteria bacterium]
MITFLKRLWFGEITGLTSAAFFIALAQILSNGMGLIRDHLLAGTFGAGHQLDAYYAAFRLPDFLYSLIILGAFTAGFIPVFTEYLKTHGKEKASELTQQVLSIITYALIVACGVLAFFAPQIVPRMTPGFDAATMRLTITLSRILFLSPILLGISTVMGGVLQSMRRMFVFAFAPLLYNAGIIFGILVLSPHFGMMGVAWGVILGALFHLLVQWSVAGRLMSWRFVIPSFASEGVRRMFRLMIPRTVALAVSQINLVVLLALASSLEAGSVAVFNLANNIQSVPLSVIGLSFALAAFPILSRSAGAQDEQTFGREVVRAAQRIVFFVLPLMALFILLRVEIVAVILGDGKFSPQDTLRTATVVAWFSFSLLAQSLVPLLARAFYAIQDTWTPFIISVICELVNLGLALLLRPHFHIMGLAMSFSAAAMVNLLLLWIFLRRKRRLATGFFLRSLGKTLVATCVMSLVVFVLHSPVWMIISNSSLLRYHVWWSLLTSTGIVCIVGALAFCFVAWLIKSEEFEGWRVAIAQRFFKHQF